MIEEQLAGEVVNWLRDDGWDVYQEVRIFDGGGRADIVAVRGGIYWCIECKMALTFDVVAQAARWRNWAHWGSVAVPRPVPKAWSRNHGRDFAYRVCEERGVGVILVGGDERVNEVVGPRLNRRPVPTIKHIRDGLNEAHKHYAPAGNAENRFWSPYKQTCGELKKVVSDNPGIRMKDAIDKIRHHYASDSRARTSLAKWIDAGKVDGIRSDIVAGKRCLFSSEKHKGG